MSVWVRKFRSKLNSCSDASKPNADHVQLVYQGDVPFDEVAKQVNLAVEFLSFSMLRSADVRQMCGRAYPPHKDPSKFATIAQKLLS